MIHYKMSKNSLQNFFNLSSLHSPLTYKFISAMIQLSLQLPFLLCRIILGLQTPCWIFCSLSRNFCLWSSPERSHNIFDAFIVRQLAKCASTLYIQVFLFFIKIFRTISLGTTIFVLPRVNKYSFLIIVINCILFAHPLPGGPKKCA